MLVALLLLFWMSCYCKCPVALPHGAWVGLQFVIVVFPDHTHFLRICDKYLIHWLVIRFH